MSFNKNDNSGLVIGGVTGAGMSVVGGPGLGLATGVGLGMAVDRYQKNNELRKPSPPQRGATPQKYLFKFARMHDQFGGNAESGASPELLHIAENPNLTGNHRTHMESDTFVNVVETFPWHNSPQGLTTTNTVPYVDMIEHDILSNPMLNQIAANLSVGSDSIPDIIKDTVDDQSSAFRQSDEISTWDKIEKGLDPNMFDKVKNGSTLFPYNGMYSTQPTGFRYIFPYYSSTHHQIQNTFSTDRGTTGSGMDFGALSIGENLSEAIANVSKGVSMNIVAPGQYIEKSKFYGFSGREKTYQFNFPISNTKTIGTLTEKETISRNWQLIFLLMYQNSPNRMTRDLILPPAIYEAHIPGVWYSRFAYISQLNIEFLGTRRMMTVDLKGMREDESGGETNISIKAVIPEVFNVTIGLTELVAESQNMLYHMSKGRNVITTGNVTNNKDDWLTDD